MTTKQEPFIVFGPQIKPGGQWIAYGPAHRSYKQLLSQKEDLEKDRDELREEVSWWMNLFTDQDKVRAEKEIRSLKERVKEAHTLVDSALALMKEHNIQATPWHRLKEILTEKP